MGKIQIVIMLCLCFACGPKLPDERTASESDTPHVPRQGEIFSGDIVFNETGKLRDLQYDGKKFFTEDVSSGHVFSLDQNPSNITIDASSGIITLDSETSALGLYAGITIKATEISSEKVLEKTISIALNGDPLREHAWHLENTAQKTFMLISGSLGYDLNVSPVFEDDITGQGIRIAISDSGVEVTHDDLFDNALAGQHRDYSLSAPYLSDPTPTSAHGTAVTGIIAAMGWNNLGSIGIAPHAKFAGFQFLESTQSTALLIHQSSGDFDIFNFSYGDSIFQDNLSDADYLDHLRFQTLTDNKIYVKAAGNEYLLGVGTTCASHNANFPFENESPFLIVVGALNADGAKATYSSQGSNLWVTAPGGEGSARSFSPRILTTDLSSCLKGYAKASPALENDFEYGHTLNEACNYTSIMNGTSAATPMVSGVIALMKQANPSLKMRDVKHILASTAIKVDANNDRNDFGNLHPSNLLSGCTKMTLTGHEYEQGWATNAAGFHFHNFYGFGLVDAKAAVDAAKTYTFVLGSQVEQNKNFNNPVFGSGTVNLSIPDNSASGVSSVISVSNENALTVESVQVKVRVSHGASGQVGVELTSPSGLKSILMNINNSFLLLDADEDDNLEGDSDLNIVLTSNAFYGENSEGDWTVKVIDGASGTTGTLIDWNINILGH